MRRVLTVVLMICSFGLAQLAPNDVAAAEAAMKAIRPDGIRAHMEFLTDGLLQGRAPGTAGYDIAAAYVATQMEAMGLKPAGANGSWFQAVPLRKFRAIPDQTSLAFVRNGKAETLTFGKDYVTAGDQEHTEGVVDAPIIFVGYGVIAPELKYDDYAGLDVRGKVVVLLYGAPPRFPSVQRAYFSDLVNKERNAVARGAVGFLVVMTPDDQKRLRWEWLAPQIQAGSMKWLEADGKPHDSFPQMRGGVLWLSQHGAELLFAAAPKSLDQVFAGAREGRVDHFALPVTVKMHTVSQHAAIQSPNIIGVLPGSDPQLRREYVVYSAHLDHLGICPAVNGDNVCHGARDNASGTAAVLEIARAFAQLPHPPRRSILFAFVTGEEKGLLGSDYFAHHPTVPAEAMAANINIDGLAGIMYPLKDIVALGADDSSLGNNAQDAARRMGLDISPDPSPQEVFFIRSDQYPFVRRGVPAVAIMEGFKSTDPKVNGEEILKKWLVTVYHTPKDNMNQPFNFESAAKSTQLNFLVGYEVAQQAQRPRWNAEDFFGLRFAGARK
jgi:hypothetical protein